MLSVTKDEARRPGKYRQAAGAVCAKNVTRPSDVRFWG